MRNRSLILASSVLIAGVAAAAMVCIIGGRSHATAGTEETAAELRVCPSGCAYSSVQAAVDDADPGDVIKVAQGTYSDVHVREGITQVVYISKSVVIRGGYTTANWTAPDPETHPTTLDAGRQGRVLVITGTIAPTVEGLRITNGNATGLGPFWWGDVGGGIYIADATATISGNLVYSNTADRGGGLYLWYSPATLNSNTVSNNVASAGGGGVELLYSPAMLNDNTVSGNRISGGGFGGGLILNSSNATVSGNVIHSNIGTSGGGVSVYWSTAILSDNFVYSNTAYYGGGLHVYGGPCTFVGNVVTGNIAFEGGGMYMDYCAPRLVNNVVANNSVEEATGIGSGIYVEYSSPDLLHTTIAGNSGGDGSGVYVTGYEWSGTYYPSTAAMTNTIISSHTVGVTVTAGNTATLHATLWHANTGGNWGGAGTVNRSYDYTGDPAFAPDGYHVITGSMAIDRGVDAGVATDIDGDPRPQGGSYDIGADEFPAAPADVVWDKQVRINDGSFQAWDSGPFTVVPGDDVTILERVWVTATRNVSFTLGEAWTPSLEWMTYEATAGSVSHAERTSVWSVQEAAPNSWLVLTKTLHAVASPEYTDTLTETLTVQGAALQLPERIVEFRQPHPQPAWDKSVRIGDGEPQPWDAGPFAVMPGDTLTVMDRVWITHTSSVTFTLAHTWGPALEAEGWTSDAGTAVAGPGALTWRGMGEPANQWHTLTTTLRVAGSGWLYESLTETLAVVDATTQPPQRTVRLVNLEASTGCYARINDDPTTYPTVQSAVDRAMAGDLIKVAGRCTTINHYGGLSQVVYLDKSLTIRGGYTTTNWTAPDPKANPTTLDAQGQGRVLHITGYIAPTIEGLRITGGDARWFGSTYWDRRGGGVYVRSATAVLSGNVIYSNTAVGGGGLALAHSPATLRNNVVCSNTATDGGGLGLYYLYYGRATLSGNTVSGNTASQQGGGLYLYDTEARLTGNIASGNDATYGGGLYLFDSNSTLTNFAVVDNKAEDLGAGIALYRSFPHLIHTTIARNTGGDGSGVHILEGAPSRLVFTNTIVSRHTVGIKVGAGNSAILNATLWHANTTDWDGTVNSEKDYRGDPAFAADGYHLTPSSEAIDKGVGSDVMVDVDGEGRPAGDGPDLGADEWAVKRVYLPLIVRSLQRR